MMTETLQTHHTHDHHHHDSDVAGDGMLALHAEDLYLQLARSPQLKASVPVNADGPVPYDLTALKQRLGSKAPDLSEAQEQVVATNFADRFADLPRSEYHEHQGHAHAGDGCGKRHGPIRRTLERMEHGALAKVRGQRAKLAVALLFRAGFFTMCPGDDIAAIGLQVYGSVSGQQQEHHHEESHPEANAVLPARPRIELKRGKALVRLPLEPEFDPRPMINSEPATSPAPPPRIQTSQSADITSAGHLKNKPPRYRRRLAALGMLAVAVFGGAAADASQEEHNPEPRIAVEVPSYRIELPPLATQPSNAIELPPLTIRGQEPHITKRDVRPGESQWSLAEQAIRTANIEVTPARTQAIATYIAHANKATNPNADIINAGQQLRIPNAPLTTQIVATLQR